MRKTKNEEFSQEVPRFLLFFVCKGTGGLPVTYDELVGLESPERDAEIISEQIKVHLNPIPNFNLKFEKVEEKTLIVLYVYSGDQTPYYYDGDGQLIAYHRVGNESVPADPIKLQELVLKGSVSSFDCLTSKYSFDDMSFTKLPELKK